MLHYWRTWSLCYISGESSHYAALVEDLVNMLHQWRIWSLVENMVTILHQGRIQSLYCSSGGSGYYIILVEDLIPITMTDSFFITSNHISRSVSQSTLSKLFRDFVIYSPCCFVSPKSISPRSVSQSKLSKLLCGFVICSPCYSVSHLEP